MQDFRGLKVWQKAHELTLRIYKVTRTFPREETYNLCSQIRRSSTSIGANISEGCGRKGDIDFARFLQISMGSASELEYHILLAKDLNYIKQKEYGEIHTEITDIKRMLTSLMSRLRAKS